jgi:glycerol-3-phosphate dehydrogenase (NAD(P)+)
MKKVTVLGAGAWGTTMAQVLVDCGNDVLIWGRDPDVITEINKTHTNKKYLKEHVLPEQLKATAEIKSAFAHSPIIVLAIPAQNLRQALIDWKDLFPPDSLIISTLKGIELTTELRMTEVISEVLGTKNFAILTGPNLADELILRQPAGAVAASVPIENATKVQELFSNPYYRVYTSTDVVGCELAGSIKSVIALAVGMSIGMGLGENTQAMLITRGLNEVARIGAAHGADPLSAAGLAGMGDLVASCGSALSRNRTFGEVLGRTGSMNDARSHVAKTVEGVASSSAVIEIAHRVGVEVPVIEAVADVVAGTITPSQALERLMSMTTTAENFIR